MDFQETGTRAPLNQKPRKLLRHVPPGSPTLATRNRRKTIQAEKMKKEKTKYKIKKKEEKSTAHATLRKIGPRCKSRFLTSTLRWTWKRSKTFSLKKKNALFKSQNISKMIKKNNATLYNLKSTPSKKKKNEKPPSQHFLFPAIFISTDTYSNFTRNRIPLK